MRRFVIGTGLLALTLVISVALGIAMPRVHTPIQQQLEQAVLAAQQEDWAAARMLAEAADSRWQRCRKFTAAVADHEPLEAIDAGFAQTMAFLDCRDSVEFTAACASLAQSVRAMAISHSLIWWNFL